MADVSLKDVGGKVLTVGVFSLVLSALFPFAIAFTGGGAMALAFKDEKKK